MKLLNIFTRTFLLCFLFSTAVLADDGHFGGEGSTVFPMNKGKVRMVSENVVLRCAPGMVPWKVDATCQFIFENPGKETRITMGFPAQTDEPDETGKEPELVHDFTTTIDRHAVPVKLKKVVNSLKIKGLDFEDAYVWKAKFAANQTVTIVNTYQFEEDQSQDYKGPQDLFARYFAGKDADVPITPCMGIYYILKTGALWDGRMDHADVTFELDRSIPPEFMEIEPGGFNYKDGVIHWHFEDFKPTEDINVQVHGAPLRPLRNQITDEFIDQYLNIHFEPKDNPYAYDRTDAVSGKKKTHKAMQELEDSNPWTPSDELKARVNTALKKLAELKEEVRSDTQKYHAEDLGYNLYMIHRYELFLGTLLDKNRAVYGVLQQ